jgi:hypothetical protein
VPKWRCKISVPGLHVERAVAGHVLDELERNPADSFQVAAASIKTSKVILR